MNKSYHSLWNAALSSWVAVPETARTQSSGKSRVASCVGGLRLAVLAFAVASAWAMPAAAATLYWDTNGNTAGLGGTGMWDTSNPSWNTSSTGTGGTLSAWNNAAPDNALFAGSAGTVILTQPISVGNVSFSTNGYVLNAGQLTLAGTGGSTFTTATGITATINSAITGTAPLVKSGAGTLNISNIGNNYSGGTVVSQGTVVSGAGVNPSSANNYLGSGTITLGDANTGSGNVALLMNYGNFFTNQTVFGNNIVVSSLAGGQVTIGTTFFSPGTNGSQYSGTITLGRDVTLQGGNADRTTYIGKITGTGNLTVTGGRTTFQNSINDFLGTVTVTSGATLQLSALNAVPSTSDVTINAGGVLDTAAAGAHQTIKSLNGAGTFLGSVTGHATTLTLGANNGSGVFSGAIQNGGVVSLVKTGSGTQSLSGTGNSYTGSTTLSGGTLSVTRLVDGGAASSIGQSTNAAGNLVLNGGALSYVGAATSTNRLFTINGSGTLDASGSGALTFSNAGAIVGNGVLTLSGSSTSNNSLAPTLGGTSSLVKGGSGTWIVSGNNSYTGGTAFNGGTLQVSSDGNLGAASGAIRFDGGTLRLGSSFDLAIGRAVVLGAGGGTIDVQGFDSVWGQGASGSGALTKAGAGTLVLTGSNTYGGGTTIAGGTLQIGAGGTSGAIVGDVTDNGALIFNRSNALTLEGAISGAGSLSQIGGGVTTLSGNSSTFSGSTSVTNGTLLVDGVLGGSGSAMSVSNGGALGGNGTVGGSVAISDGILAPGTMPGNVPGTLTINGNLSLTGASRLNYKFGQVGVVGGPLNDLTVVGGNLTLDGTLNVATSAGGSFGPGLYRVISYAGTLTDNGLVLGTQPVGSTSFVQTAVANQVNLVNTAGLTLNYWDGPAVPRNNGVVNGGNGTWQTSAGNDNWTEATGAINAPYANGAFAIFSAVPGTVQVDNSLGAVVSGGMQFASSGYRVQGQPITLAAGSNTLRVGDGSGPSAGYVATIASALTGAGGIDKTDLGTLVLTGTNSYTGGTTVSAGTLQLGAGGASGAIVGNVLNNGTLAFNRPDDVIFDPVISGGGGVIQRGAGALTFTADQSYTGGTTISSGALSLGNGGTSGTVVGNVVNNAALVFNRSDDLSFGGAISGAGMVAKVGANKLVLTGDSTFTGGTTIAGGGTLQLGNGGTSGSIVGDVVNSGTLVFNRSNDLSFAGSISGAGALSHIGSSSTTLTGDSGAFAGSASVTNGALWIEGLLGNAASTLNVATGGTLGGTGTFGGSMTIADGTLAPGNPLGTLTIGGNLSLAAPSVLAYEFGRSNVVGGALNDLTLVGGNLTLDGTINVSAPGGGAAGPGLYRVISYGGTLTNNGLAIGTQPAGSSLFVQTSVPQQVNLVNTAGLALNFWDAGNTTRNNGVINGGNGVWQATGGNDNWTESTGAINAPYATGAFGIFSATPGTVTVDNSLGDVVSGGMQFASSGYRVQGQPITLAAGSNTLRVGDGSGPGASYLATIASSLNGAGGIDKTDLGTLVLTGANGYTGGTTISAGTLQVSLDTNLGAATGALNLAGGTLRTTGDIATARPTTISAAVGSIDTAAGTTLTHTGNVAGGGALLKLGAGTLVLGADATYRGGTTIAGGTLRLGNGGTMGSIVGNVLNNGALVFDRSDSLTFAGAISGSGTVTKLNGANLTLAGANSYSGGTALKGGQITVGNNNALGSGALSMDEGTTLGFAADRLKLGNAVVLTGTSDPVIDTGSFTETLSGVISGGGALTKNGSGTLVVSGANTYSGATNVAFGSLQAGAANSFSAASAHRVAAGATLDTGGFNQRVAALTNSGTVNLASGVAGSALTVAGPYVGKGGLLRLGTTLNGSASASDRLVLDGPTAVASGSTSVQIVNLGGLGGLTTGNGIEVISATNGATTTAQTTRNAFSLAGGHVDAGAYEYRLIAADALGAGENWYLRSTTTLVIPPPVDEVLPPGQPTTPAPPPVQLPTYRAEVPLVAALPSQLRQADLAMLGNLHRRVGDEDPATLASTAVGTAPDSASTGARRTWGRLVYADLDIQQQGIAQPHSDGRLSGLQVGTDLFATDAWKAGIYVGYLDGSADVSGNARGLTARVGNNDLRSRFLGGYATWMDASGWYVDSVLQGASQRYNVNPDINPHASGKASSFSASVESGKAFALNERWSIEPQAQLAWQHSSFDDLVLGGARVRQDAGDGWIGRLGVRVKGDLATGAGRLQPYGRVNVYYASFGDDVASFVGPAGVTAIVSPGGYSAAEVAAGATLSLTRATSLYGEIGHMWSIGGNASVKASVQASAGLKVRW